MGRKITVTMDRGTLINIIRLYEFLKRFSPMVCVYEPGIETIYGPRDQIILDELLKLEQETL